MSLEEKIRKILKTQYGIETDEELIQAVEEMPKLDIGIFVNRQQEENIA